MSAVEISIGDEKVSDVVPDPGVKAALNALEHAGVAYHYAIEALAADKSDDYSIGSAAFALSQVRDRLSLFLHNKELRDLQAEFEEATKPRTGVSGEIIASDRRSKLKAKKSR